MSDEAWEKRRLERLLDRPASEPVRLMDDRQAGRDCLTQMRVYRARPDVLANALLDMGVTESGDEAPDKR